MSEQFEFDMDNPSHMVAWQRIMSERILKATRIMANAIADYFLQIATDEIREGTFFTAGGSRVKGALAQGELLRSGTKHVEENMIKVGFGAAHADKVEYGLTAQEAQLEVTYEDIREWVKVKQIGTPAQQPHLAKRILERIHELGISPRPFFRRALSSTEANINQIINSVMPEIEKIMNGEDTDPSRPNNLNAGTNTDTTNK
jgi:hypothetical protein